MFTNVERFMPLARAYELGVRQNELYLAMLTVEQCGASPELTEAIMRLGKRMNELQAQLEKEIHASNDHY